MSRQTIAHLAQLDFREAKNAVFLGRGVANKGFAECGKVLRTMSSPPPSSTAWTVGWPRPSDWKEEPGRVDDLDRRGWVERTSPGEGGSEGSEADIPLKLRLEQLTLLEDLLTLI